VVDAEHLALVEDRQQGAIELSRVRDRAGERLLDHDARLGVLAAR